MSHTGGCVQSHSSACCQEESPAANRSEHNPKQHKENAMTIAQLLEKRNKLMVDASAIVAGENITVEQRSQFDVMHAEVSTINGDIARLQAVEEHRAAMRNPVNQPVVDPSESHDPEERAEVRAARQKASMRKYLATGQVETRDLTIAANGGVVVPVGFNPEVIEAQKSYGEIYDIVTVLKTDSGEPIKIVTDNDTTNGLVAVGSGATETDPSLAGETLQVSDFTTGAVAIENSLIKDAGFDLESFIRDKFLRRYFRGASSLIVAGNGGNVASLTGAYNAALTVQTAAIGVVAYKDLVALMTALDPAYGSNAVFAMSNVTLGTVLNIVTSTGLPIFSPWTEGASAGFAGKILGRPVKLVQQLPVVATGNVPILYGDFKQGYTFRQVNPGIVILRNPYSLMNVNKLAFYGFARVGGLATDAGTHPIASLNIK
jgi:HK97 family phage major capsid protein